MKSFFEMLKLVEFAKEMGLQDPVPLSKIPPQAARVAVQSGLNDGDQTKKDDVVSVNTGASGPVQGLKPTQAQLKSSNFVAMAVSNLLGQFDLSNMNAIVAENGEIMDGHHRWAAALCVDPSQTVKYTQITLPLDRLITLLNIYTKGALGNAGKDAKGEDIKTAFAAAKKLLERGLTEDGVIENQGSMRSKEEVSTAYGKVKGANGDPQAGLNILKNNIDMVLGSDLVVPKTNLNRKEMPVIEKGGKAEAAMAQLVTDIQAGKIDHNSPISQDVLNASKVDASTGQQNVGANGQATQQNVGANGQATQQNVGANGQATQQNVGVNKAGVPGTGQQNVGVNKAGVPGTGQQNVVGYQNPGMPEPKKKPVQAPVQQRQTSHTSHDGPSLNEWAILAGIKK
jgi:hypothetical protein